MCLIISLLASKSAGDILPLHRISTLCKQRTCLAIIRIWGM